MPDNNAPIERPAVDAGEENAVPDHAYRHAVIMDSLALVFIVIGITVAVIGVYIVFGIGSALITAGVALTVFGVAIAYR